MIVWPRLTSSNLGSIALAKHRATPSPTASDRPASRKVTSFINRPWSVIERTRLKSG